MIQSNHDSITFLVATVSGSLVLLSSRKSSSPRVALVFFISSVLLEVYNKGIRSDLWVPRRYLLSLISWFHMKSFPCLFQPPC